MQTVSLCTIICTESFSCIYTHTYVYAYASLESFKLLAFLQIKCVERWPNSPPGSRKAEYPCSTKGLSPDPVWEP